MKRSLVLILMGMLFATFAYSQEATIAFRGGEGCFTTGSPANFQVEVTAGDAFGQLCIVNYTIKKDGEVMESLPEGALSYSVRLAEGSEDFESQITAGEGSVTPTVEYDEQTYSIQAFTLGIFDVSRNRPINFTANFAEVGTYTVDVKVVKATAEETVEINPNDFIAEEATAITPEEIVCEKAITINIVDPITITTAGIEEEYTIGDVATFETSMNTNSTNESTALLDELVMVHYVIKKDGNVIENLPAGALSYSVRLAGEENFEGTITAGEGYINPTVQYDNNTYSIQAFTLGIFDNSECVNRNRSINFEANFTEVGTYTIDVNIVKATATETVDIHEYEACDGTHQDKIATEATATEHVLGTTNVEFDVVDLVYYTVNAAVLGGHGSIALVNVETNEEYATDTISVLAGTSVKVVFTPDEFYALDTVMRNNFMIYPSSSNYVDTVTLTYTISSEEMNKDYDITARFKDTRAYFDIHVEITTAGGTVTPKDTTVVIGSNVTLQVRPNDGYKISQLEIDGDIIANYALTEIEFLNITEDHEVVISFFPSSIEEEAFANLSVYPNPNNGQFTVTCDEFDGEVTYQLYNVSGSVVEERTLNNENTVRFDNELSAGTYFLRIISGDKVATRKIVVE